MAHHKVAAPFFLANAAFRVAGLQKTARVKKKGDQWCVTSEDNPDWNGGCYPTKELAKKRLKEVEMFKHIE